MRNRWLALLLLLCFTACASVAKKTVLTAASVINFVDRAGAPLYAQASQRVLQDPAVLTLARSGPDGPAKALALWQERLGPWEKLRAAVNLGRAACFDAGKIIDAARAPDRERQTLLAMSGAVAITNDLLRALPALGVPTSPWLDATSAALCGSAQALVRGQSPPLADPCAAPPAVLPAAPAPARPSGPPTSKGGREPWQDDPRPLQEQVAMVTPRFYYHRGER